MDLDRSRETLIEARVVTDPIDGPGEIYARMTGEALGERMLAVIRGMAHWKGNPGDLILGVFLFERPLDIEGATGRLVRHENVWLFRHDGTHYRAVLANHPPPRKK